MIKCGWYLDGLTLAHFIKNYSLKGVAVIEVAVAGKMDIFKSLMGAHGITAISETQWRMPSGVVIKINRKRDSVEVVEAYAKDFDRIGFQFPPNMGAVCDQVNPGWTEIIKPTSSYVYPEGCFFDAQRRKNGHDLIVKLLECGKKVGIDDKMFLGFGGALGYALIGDFMPNDDDADLCILGDEIPQEQLHAYFMECRKAGLMENRERGPVSVEGKYVWFSLGPKSPYTEHGMKSCVWIWFKHGGFYWHSKGKKWIGRKGLNQEFPTAKGIPESIFNGELKTVNFGGIEVKVPKMLGSCLDWQYPGWINRKQESSVIKAVLVMPKDDRKSWFIENHKREAT
jgi:hypothetical protein